MVVMSMVYVGTYEQLNIFSRQLDFTNTTKNDLINTTEGSFMTGKLTQYYRSSQKETNISVERQKSHICNIHNFHYISTYSFSIVLNI